MKLRQFTFMLLMTIGMMAQAQNTVQKVEQVTGFVELTEAIDYTITNGKEPITAMASIDIKNPEATVVFENVRPDVVVSSYLSKITSNGVALTDNSNCRVSIYRCGTIVFAHSDNKNADGTPFYPVTMYSDEDFTEEIESYNGTNRYISGKWKDKARSFTLKRGYMCTVANDAAGTGYSHCYIANSKDLKIKLRKELAGKLGFFRIFRWQWPGKLGMSDSRDEDIIKGTNASWYYDWGAGTTSRKYAEYVPQRHHEAGTSNGEGYKGAWPSFGEVNASDNTCTHVLGQNEPDNTSGKGEVYTYVTSIPSSPRDKHGDYPLINVAKDFLYSGKRIGTFACCNPNTGWVSEYVNWCRQNNIRVDFVATHYYIGGQKPENCINSLKSLYNATGLPVWATEWNNGANWTDETSFYTDSEGWYTWDTGDNTYKNGVWLTDVLKRADKEPWLERLAVYNAVETKREIKTSGALTNAAKVLGTYQTGFAYNEANEYFMPWYHKDPADLEGTYDAKKQTVTLKWTHNNSKQTDSICVLRKLEGESTFTVIENLGMHDMGSVTFTESVSDLSGTITYKIRDYDTDKKTRHTNETIVNVAPSHGTDMIQYGKLSIEDAEEKDIYFSETLSATPCIFVGAITNNNGNFYAGNVTAYTGDKVHFTFAFCPWQGKSNTFTKTEELPFMAIVPGNYKCGDLDCEVGEVSSEKAGTSTSDPNWTNVTEVVFNQPFPEGVTPVVLTDIRKPSYATASTKPTSLSVRIFDVTNTGFKFIIYSEEASQRKIALPQKVCYLAITPGYGTIDADNNILVAAGHGVDNPIYGLSTRENNFYYQVFNEEDGTTTNEQLYLKSPTVFAALQTNNYPAACMLRRVNIKTKDEDGTEWITGIKAKRLLDHDITVDGTTISATSTADIYSSYRDNVGWIAITSKIKGYTPEPTAIHATSANQQGQLIPRIVNGRVQVDGTSTFEVYNITGAKVPNNTVLTPGIYVIKANGKSGKLLVK